MSLSIFKNNPAFLKNSLWLFFLRCVGFLQSILTIKIYFGYLDTAHFAFLIVLFSYQIFFSFFDLGISNAVVNKGVKHLVGNNLKELTVLFQGSITFLLIWIIFLNGFISILLQSDFFSAFIFRGLNNRLFVVNMFLLCTFLSTLRCGFSIVNNYRLVFNQTYYNGIFDSLALLLGIAGQLLAVYFHLDFVWHVLIIFGMPVLGHVANIIHFAGQRSYLLTSYIKNIKFFFSKEITNVIFEGGKFFSLQLASTFAYNSVPIILSFYAKTEEISIYGILVRLFNPISSLITVFLQPQWAFLSQSYLNRKFDIVKKSYRFSLIFVLTACFIYFLTLYLFKGFISSYLLKGEVTFSLNILVLFCIWIILSNIAGVFSTILNALNEISFQVFFSFLVVLFFLLEILLFVPKYGLTAVLFFISFNVLVTGIIPSFIKTKRLLNG